LLHQTILLFKKKYFTTSFYFLTIHFFEKTGKRFNYYVTLTTQLMGVFKLYEATKVCSSSNWTHRTWL